MPLIYIIYNFFENIRQLEQQPQEIIPSGSEVLLQTPKDQFKMFHWIKN